MFNPLNNPEMEQWFQRFNAPLKRLPVDERSELHLEVRQHLEALAAANEELGSSSAEAANLALKQFGDPHKIGRRLFQEWQHSRDWSPDSRRSIWFGVGQHLMVTLLVGMPVALWAQYPGLLGMLNKENPPSWDVFFAIVSAVIVNTAIGCKYPFQAIKGALYAGLFWRLIFLVWVFPLLSPSQSAGLAGFLLLCSTLDCAVSYFASVTKRGWYRPLRADFKLPLSHVKPRAVR